MSDLISRQAAIDAVHEDLDGCRNWNASGTETANEVEMVLDCLPSAQTWIPVTERLPEIGGTYIVSGRMKYDCEKEYSYFVDAAAYDPADGWDTFHDNWEGQQDFAITAWMPLPEPYKEGDRKTEPTISKMEQVEDELQTERSACDTCQWYNGGIPCGVEPSVCKREVKDNPTEQEADR